ncbi:MAG TPA: AI-2E family transporter [Vicinamibacterales bacterium]|nr:AI-2E family transporter [Vicinamibacterales bacterium]
MSTDTARFVSTPDAAQPAAPPSLEPQPPDAGPLVPVPVNMRNAAVTVLAVIALILLLQYAQPVFIPLVLGLLISYALDPAVTRLEKFRLPRAVGAAVMIAALVGGGGFMLYQLRTQAQQIIQQLPEGARRLRQTLERQQGGTNDALKQVQQAATELQKAADSAGTAPSRPGVTRVQVEDGPINVSDYVMWGSMGLAAAAGQLLLILFLAYFLLATGDLYRRKLVKIVGPSLTKKKVTVQILQEIDRQIESFLMMQLFTSAVVGVVTWLAFRWIGLEQAGVWGLMAGIFNSIPYVGPIIVSGGTAVVTFLQFGNIHTTVLASSVALCITSLEGFLLTPWLTSRAARMNAVAVFVGLLFWGWVWNIWGMLLAVPMLMVVKAICDHVEDFKGIGELLGD